ncbi:hypothetical protein [Kineosporia succinea]
MPGLQVDPQITDGAWTGQLHNLAKFRVGTLTHVGILPHGTPDGDDAFAVMGHTSGRTHVVLEVSWDTMRDALAEIVAARPQEPTQ